MGARAEYGHGARAEYGPARAEYGPARAEYGHARAEYGHARAEYGRACNRCGWMVLLQNMMLYIDLNRAKYWAQKAGRCRHDHGDHPQSQSQKKSGSSALPYCSLA